MKTVNIKGKEYVPVHERILELRNTLADYSLETEATFYPDQTMWVVKATLSIYNEHGTVRIFNGHAQEIIGDGYINKTSALENCETSAIGRAIGAFGIGIENSYASADELKKAIDREGYNETNPEQDKPWLSQKNLDAILTRMAGGDGEIYQKTLDYYKMKKEYRSQLDQAHKDYSSLYFDTAKI